MKHPEKKDVDKKACTNFRGSSILSRSANREELSERREEMQKVQGINKRKTKKTD